MLGPEGTAYGPVVRFACIADPPDGPHHYVWGTWWIRQRARATFSECLGQTSHFVAAGIDVVSLCDAIEALCIMRVSTAAGVHREGMSSIVISSFAVHQAHLRKRYGILGAAKRTGSPSREQGDAAARESLDCDDVLQGLELLGLASEELDIAVAA